ncbi:helix-turn-helix domain-containing protein [Desulfobulbus propionicus]
MVELVVKKNWNLLKAWRKHLGMSQKALAAAMGLKPEQLVD